MAAIFIDADACPVKDDIYRIALRQGIKVVVVSGGALRVPARAGIEHVRVKSSLDAADDWIAERAGAGDIVVTADVPLAARCLGRQARVIAPDGRLFTDDSIGSALASRELLAELRQMGAATGGPAAYSKADRARFLARLGEAIQSIVRG